MLIYTPNITPRLHYILDTILPLETVLVDNPEKFRQYPGARINYSANPVSEQEFWIVPHSLLAETGTGEQDIRCFVWNGLKAFFKSPGDAGFDIFSAAFYLITRYEEYLPNTPDAYGRFAHRSSLAYREGFLKLPIVDLWVIELEKMIAQKFPGFRFPQRRFRYIPTYDIDIAYSYRYHSFKDRVGGLFKNILQDPGSSLKERLEVLLSKREDPFDTFQFLDQLTESFGLVPIYFFLMAEKRKGYDKNISPHHPAMKQLIRELASRNQIGIHPSWQSGDDPIILKKEIRLLSFLSNGMIHASRQHYIRMTLPGTYRLLLENGIQDDYSMGYGSINGFRASTSVSFFWYDLEKESQTVLRIHPFCYMEANSHFEQQDRPEQAAAELQQYFAVVKSVNGELITIFHNHLITQQKPWQGWRKLYHDFLIQNFSEGNQGT